MKDNKDIRILLTDAGHPVTASVVDTLKNKKESFYVVGSDFNREKHSTLWVDLSYFVSSVVDRSYIEKMLTICKKEKIDLVIPWTNEEAVVISKHAKAFNAIGTKILCGDNKVIELVSDKGLMYQSLNKSKIPIPNYELVSSPKELEKAVYELGYPKKPVVVKPRNLSGARGMCILDTKVNINSINFGNRMPLESILEILAKLDSKKRNNLDYLVMEYLGGEDYSVDTLCDRGKLLLMIPRLRIKSVGGVSQVGKVKQNVGVEKIVRRVVKYFGLHLNANVQVRYSKDGKGPYVYDINPRISGSIVSNHGAGVDLFYYGIKMSLGMKVPSFKDMKYQEVTMVRYWKEGYLKKNSLHLASPKK